jgi:hypothetical protein
VAEPVDVSEVLERRGDALFRDFVDAIEVGPPDDDIHLLPADEARNLLIRRIQLCDRLGYEAHAFGTSVEDAMTQAGFVAAEDDKREARRKPLTPSVVRTIRWKLRRLTAWLPERRCPPEVQARLVTYARFARSASLASGLLDLAECRRETLADQLVALVGATELSFDGLLNGPSSLDPSHLSRRRERCRRVRRTS